MRRSLFAGLGLMLGCLPAQPIEHLDGGADASWVIDDAGEPTGDAGEADAGIFDAGEADAGPSDSGIADGGASDGGAIDSGSADGGPPRVLGVVVDVPPDASFVFVDAGYASASLLGRVVLPTVPAASLSADGFAVAVSPQSLVIAEGSQCQLSFVNRYGCDYRWLATDGGVLATVANAYGLPHPRGEVMMLYRDDRYECVDPHFSALVLRSAAPALVDLDTGLIRHSWSRAETSALRDVYELGDLVSDPNGGRSCDAGAAPSFSLQTTYRRVRAPSQAFLASSAVELGDDRLLVVSGTGEVTRVEADGGTSVVLPAGPTGASTSAEVHLDTFTLQRDLSYYRGDLAGGALRSLVTLTTNERFTHGAGRFASVVELPDYGSTIVVDSQGLLPDLRYPIGGQLLERAPLMLGRSAAEHLVMARLDLGTAATSPFDIASFAHSFLRLPHDDAAVVIDRQRVAWLIDVDGAMRLADDAIELPVRSFKAQRDMPNLVLLVLRHSTGGPLELVAVDRHTQRLVTLSQQAHVNTSPSYLGGCDVPGVLTPGGAFIYFAEPSTVQGQLELFLVRSDLTEEPRHVGTTLATDCVVPVVSRDGTRIAVQTSLGGAPTVSVATWQ